MFFSVAMVAFAGAAILYDTSNVLHHYPEDRAVGAALELFASVALLFWYILRLFMSRRYVAAYVSSRHHSAQSPPKSAELTVAAASATCRPPMSASSSHRAAPGRPSTGASAKAAGTK